jgi:hypothetical protein
MVALPTVPHRQLCNIQSIRTTLLLLVVCLIHILQQPIIVVTTLSHPHNHCVIPRMTEMFLHHSPFKVNINHNIPLFEGKIDVKHLMSGLMHYR